jgi:hypothetical protein
MASPPTIRRCAAVTLLFVLAGCSKSATPSSSNAPAPSPSAAIVASGSPAAGASSAVSHCGTNDLSASIGQASGAAGTTYRQLTLTNQSSAPCTMSGYPGVSLVDASGSQIGEPADRNPTKPSIVVTLAGNGSAYSVIGFPNPADLPSGKCSTTTSTNLRIYPPGNTRSLLVPIAERYCPGFSVTALSATPD